MPVEIKVPYLGHNVESATVSQWLKNEGETVEAAEVVLELEADKAVLEVEAPAAGTLAGIMAAAGATVKPDDILGYVAAEGEKVEIAGASASGQTTASTPESQAVTGSAATTATESLASEVAPAADTTPKPETIIVIGGGPGGYTAAIKAAQQGAKVTLVEKAKLGGTCLHTGCMPTKSYLAKVRVIDQLLASASIFTGGKGVGIDLKKMMQFKDKAVGNLTRGIQSLMKSNAIEVISGTARLTGPGSVQIEPQKGESQQLTADAIIIAGGSSPIEIPGVAVDGDRIHNTDTIWQLERIPESLLIIGSGAVGVEFACIYQVLGAKVTVVEMLPTAVPGIDSKTGSLLVKSLKKRGIDIRTDITVTGAEKKDGQVTVTLKQGETESTESFDTVLVACGRKPETEGLGCEKAGIRLEKGAVSVGSDMATGVGGLYAIGDIIGPPMLAHAAFYEAETAVNNLFGSPCRVDYRKIPYCIYSFPEVGSIGYTEEEAAERHPGFKTARFPFVANGKAMVCGETEGMVKILYDERLGEILGVHIIGEHATELIAIFAAAVNGELTIDEVADTLMAHPTLSEAAAEAAQAALGRALHLPN